MIGYYIFRLFEKFLMILPHSWRKAFFSGLATLAYHIDKKHRRIVRQNLEFVYGKELDEAFVEEISRNGYKSLAFNFLFTMEGRYMSLETLEKKVTFENLEIVKELQRQNRPIVFVTSHYGEWEVVGSAGSALAAPIMIIYKKMSNLYFQEYLLSARKHFKMTYAERHGALKALIKRMRAKEATALLIDTNVSERDGIMVDFLGKPTRQITTPAYLAQKFGAALVPIISYTDDHENYRVKIFEEVAVSQTGDDKEDLRITTQNITTWLSDVILEEPKHWFWMHRRWKTDYPEIYQK